MIAVKLIRRMDIMSNNHNIFILKKEELEDKDGFTFMGYYHTKHVKINFI